MEDRIFDIHDVVLFMTMAECLLLAVFQFVLPARNRLYGFLLAVFLLVIASGAACTLLLWNNALQLDPALERQLLPSLLIVSLLLKGPVLYLYVASITQHGFRLEHRHWLHLVPSLICVLIIALFDVTSDDLRLVAPDQPDMPDTAVNFLWNAAKIVPLAYALACAVKVQRYRRQLKDEYSHFSDTEPLWFKILVLGFLASWVWTLMVHIIAKYSSDELADALGIADNYVTFVLINALFISTLAYAHRLLTTRAEPPRSDEDEKPSEEAVERVKQIMEKDKIYLQHNVNIEHFASRLDMPVKDVSAVINKHFGTNFFEFINSYRVEEAKILLADPTSEHRTILDILLDSGFNSKSAFHRFFKRLVGVSPSEYRKQALGQTDSELMEEVS